MKIARFILISVFLFLSCQSDQNPVSIDFISYTYVLTGRPFGVALKCHRFATINKDGYVPYYYRRGVFYGKSRIEKELFDSIIYAVKMQKLYILNNRDEYIWGDVGPNLKIRILYSDGKFELVDFNIENVLFKYFGEVDNCKIPLPNNDTTELSIKKQNLIKTIWTADSVQNKILTPPPPVPDDK